MKLRFDKNSLRLRIKKSELEMLRIKTAIHETVLFPNGHFAYDLSVRSDTYEVIANLNEKSIEVILPSRLANEWMNSEEVGIYHTISFGKDRSLDIVVEKDFPCKDRPTEDNSDTFKELVEKKSDVVC